MEFVTLDNFNRKRRCECVLDGGGGGTHCDTQKEPRGVVVCEDCGWEEWMEGDALTSAEQKRQFAYYWLFYQELSKQNKKRTVDVGHLVIVVDTEERIFWVQFCPPNDPTY